MKAVFVLLFLFCLLLPACKEENIKPDDDKDAGVCVYKRNTCTNANPQYCLPPLEYIGCIPKWEAYKYGNTKLYKVESCECEL